ncbi:MAG: hypothetical protein WBA57_14050, partial [Elainellaceae cyanobacterium]
MKRDVVRDFLNLPGIVGIALVDGRSRPFFFGIDHALNFQQKEALAQGIQQVVETTPSSFESFEFQFNSHQVYIYKLEHGIILLVLTNEQLVYSSYTLLVSQLKHSLQDDLGNAIANFRLAAGNVTLSGQSYWNRKPDPETLTLSTGLSADPASTSSTQSSRQTRPNPTAPSTPTTPTTPPLDSQNGRVVPPAKTAGKTEPSSASNSQTRRSQQTPLSRQNTQPAPSSKPADPSQSIGEEAIARAASSRSEPAPNPEQLNEAAKKAAREKAMRERAMRERAARQRQQASAPSGTAPAPSSTTTNRLNSTPQNRLEVPGASPKPNAAQKIPSAQNSPPPSQKPTDQDRLAAKSGNTGNSPTPQDKPSTLKEILDALNQLSKLTTRYLGATIVANYWKSSRPPVEWLANFEVDR